MPYSFVQIERDETRTIQWSVGFLLLLYFLAAILIVLVCRAYFLGYFSSRDYSYGILLPFWGGLLTWPIAGWTFGGTAALTGIHWAFSTDALIDKTLGMMGARMAAPAITNELVFKNIVEEVSVATGGKYTIEPRIIPTSAMNAFALQDFQGRSVIGITEGLLMRLNREQLEAVVAHEAGHIASGDCLETTVTSVLFKVFDNICDGVFNIMRFSGSGRGRRSSGQIIPLLLTVLVIAWVFKFISVLGAFFISRQREYRADAISARLTRNPKALAEALYIIDQRWKGTGGIPGENMDAIFILNPRRNSLEEGEDVVANLFTTHPPVQKRISILLDMAHIPAEELKTALQRSEARVDRAEAEMPKSSGQYPEWLVFQNGQWQGPFTVAGLKELSWLTPTSMIKRLKDPATYQAASAPGVAEMFSSGLSRAQVKDRCPRCNEKLQDTPYEDLPTLLCLRCGGRLIGEEDVLNIVSKRQARFDDRIVQMAKVIMEQARLMKRTPFDPIYDEKSIPCPHCLDAGPRMTRRFVNPKYLVEIDRCRTCGRIWFDKDELEVLQYLYEKDHPVAAG